MSYFRRRIHTGDTVEVEEYYSNRYGFHDRRAPKEKPTPEQVREAYVRRQKKRLRWLLNENFHDGVDALVTLSRRKSGRKPETLAQVKEEAVKFFRRLRGEYDRQGMELKYIYCVEIGPRGSRHIHAVISGAGELPVITLARCWDGIVDVKHLYSGEYDDLADYLVKGYAMKTERTTGEELKHCYECSRNLKKPLIEIEKIREKDIRKDIKTPEGFVLDRSSVQEGVGRLTGRPYRFYKLRRIRENRENCAGASVEPVCSDLGGVRPDPKGARRAVEAVRKVAGAVRQAFGWVKERLWHRE